MLGPTNSPRVQRKGSEWMEKGRGFQNRVGNGQPRIERHGLGVL